MQQGKTKGTGGVTNGAMDVQRSALRPLSLLMLILAPFLVGFDLLRSTNKAVEEGNARMKAGKPEEALAFYDKAAARLPADAGLHFNRGAALFALSRFDEARDEFLRATEAKDASVKAAAFYNLGNAFFRGEKYKEALEAYKRSLALDPKDARAKWNLELALRRMKEEEKNKKNNGDDKNDKNENKKEDEQKQKDKEQGKQEEKQQEQQDGNQQQKQDQTPDPPEQQPSQPPEGTDEARPDQKEIDAVLDSLEKSPKALEQQRARLRMGGRPRRPAKDW